MATNRRALTIAYDYFSCKGGAGRIARAIDAAMCNDGWYVDVLACDQAASVPTDSRRRIFRYHTSNCYSASLPIGQHMAMAMSVLSCAKVLQSENDYSLVVAHHFLASLAFVDFKLTDRLKTVFVCHGIRKNHFACYAHEAAKSVTDPHEAWCYGTEAAMTEAMHALETEAICSASKVSCVSNSVAAEVSSLWPSVVPEVIPNFYCLDHNGPCDEALDSGFGLAQWRFVILFVGRWERTKGCDIVAEIARRMAQPRRYLFLHAGAIIDPPVSRYVRHVGHVDDTELVRLYQSSTLLLMPSRYEPFGLTAIEAMWHGTPVLAHRVGGLAQIVEEGVNGGLMDTLDPSRWCERIQTLLERESNVRPNRDEIRALAVRRFTGDRSIGKYLRMFRELAEQSPGKLVPANS